MPAKVDSIQYDPNRTARIALLNYVDGEKRYIVAPHGLKAGDMVMSGDDAPPTVGNCLPLSKIPLGTAIHNIELASWPRRRVCAAVPARARRSWPARPAGRRFRCRAVKFAVFRPLAGRRSARPATRIAMAIVWGKAGRRRWLGRRPHVRGTAMNPIDHPHGGGEGRTKGGRHPVSPTGKSAKGGMTRNRRKASNKAIVRRRRSRRYGVQKLVTK